MRLFWYGTDDVGYFSVQKEKCSEGEREGTGPISVKRATSNFFPLNGRIEVREGEKGEVPLV